MTDRTESFGAFVQRVVPEHAHLILAEVERLQGRVVTDGLNDVVRVVDVKVPAGYEAVVRSAKA